MTFTVIRNTGTIIAAIALFFSSTPISGQNRPLMEFSVIGGPTYNLQAKEITPSFPFSINYIFNQRLSGGLMLIYEGMNYAHERFNKFNTYEAITLEKETDVFIATGGGINVKYNILALPRFNLYTQMQLNYLKFSIWDDIDGERQFGIEDSDGEITNQYTSDPLPFEGQSALTLNLNFGLDVRATRWMSIYFQLDLRDLTKSINTYYDVHVTYKSDSTHTEVQDVNFNDVPNDQTKKAEIIKTLSFGFRFYLFDRKF